MIPWTSSGDGPFRSRGKIDEAIRIMENAVSINPGLLFAYQTLGSWP